MLRMENVSKRFGEKRVLSNLSFAFPERAVTAITGPSGVGKTTLANLILGLMEPDEGRILGVSGAQMAAVFQEDRLFEHLNAIENIRLALRRSIKAEEIQRNLTLVGLDPRDRQRVSKYSGGMRRRLAIVRAVLAEPGILVLDEPFKGLDAQTREKCCAYILKNCAVATIVLITHDPEEIRLMRAKAELAL